MSWDCWNECEKLPIRGWPKAVLLYLAARRNPKTGQCDPSLDRIARGIGANKKTVIVALAELGQLGVVSSRRRKHKPAAYTLDPKSFQNWKLKSEAKSFQKRTPRVSKFGTQTLKENPTAESGRPEPLTATAQAGRDAPPMSEHDPLTPAQAQGDPEARTRALGRAAPAPAPMTKSPRASGTNPRALGTNPRASTAHEHEARQGHEPAAPRANGKHQPKETPTMSDEPIFDLPATAEGLDWLAAAIAERTGRAMTEIRLGTVRPWARKLYEVEHDEAATISTLIDIAGLSLDEASPISAIDSMVERYVRAATRPPAGDA